MLNITCSHNVTTEKLFHFKKQTFHYTKINLCRRLFLFLYKCVHINNEWHTAKIFLPLTAWVSHGWWISSFFIFYMTMSMKSNLIRIFSQCASLHLPFLLLFIFCHFHFFFFKYIFNLCLPLAFRLTLSIYQW